jgi:hypothetical protein
MRSLRVLWERLSGAVALCRVLSKVPILLQITSGPSAVGHEIRRAWRMQAPPARPMRPWEVDGPMSLAAMPLP